MRFELDVAVVKTHSRFERSESVGKVERGTYCFAGVHFQSPLMEVSVELVDVGGQSAFDAQKVL